MVISIFNDVIGPVMRGPSSSHCAAALRIGRLARDLMGGEIRSVLVEFDRAGALPTTHETQGSDMGLFGGLLGWDAADERLPDSPQVIRSSGVDVAIEYVDAGDPHPNTYRVMLANDNESHQLIAISTGGGMMQVLEIDGFELTIGGGDWETLVYTEGDAQAVVQIVGQLEIDEVHAVSAGDRQLVQIESRVPLGEASLASLNRCEGVTAVKTLAPVLPVLSGKDVRAPFTTCSDMLSHYGDEPPLLWQAAVDYESSRGGLQADEVVARMVEIIRILRRSVEQGIAGTQYEDRILGHQSGGFKAKLDAGVLLPAGVSNRIVLYVTALMEVKSSMGVIVAAPTAGACAALPGALIAMADELGLSEDVLAKGMLAAGMIGTFVATHSTFAAEVAGCQAECGAAASMAAAGLVTMTGGEMKYAVAAASMALQSSLGLICDPVGSRVEVPCLGKNVLAATNAVSCANMALADFDPVIPLDEVIAAADRVGKSLPRELRCTALGGLATTPTSLDILNRLDTGKAGCAASCNCG